MDSREESTDTADEIMAATYEVLATHGFEGLTTQRVADEADRSQSLVHYYYDTKEELVVAFLEWIRSNETEWLDDLDGETAAERLRQFVEMQLSIPRDAGHARFNVAFLELQAAAARNDRYRAVLSEFDALVQETLAAIIREGVQTGEFRSVDPEATARMLRYALAGAVRSTLTFDDADAKDEVREATEVYIERVLLAAATDA